MQRLAALGVRLVVGELREDVTKTRKDGTPGRLKFDYGDHRNPQAAVKWLWRYLDGAKTASELYGRALVVIAAEQYASRLVLPAGQRVPAMRWSSRKDTATRALKRIAGPHLPASLRQLERAINRAHATYEQATTRPAPDSEPTAGEQTVADTTAAADGTDLATGDGAEDDGAAGDVDAPAADG